MSACPPATFQSANKTCDACGSHCHSCTDNATCLTCNQNFFLNNSTCGASCPPATFGELGVCKSCTANCASCTSAETCATCAPGFLHFNGTCVSQCPAAHFNNNGTCLACSTNCTSCDSTGCLACAPPSITKKRELFPGLPSTSPGSLALPHIAAADAARTTPNDDVLPRLGHTVVTEMFS